MNSIVNTKIFKRINIIYGDLLKTFSTTNFALYQVRPDLYTVSLLEHIKDFRYPLARKTYDEAKKGVIVPILLHEPIDPKLPALNNKIPQTMFTFGVPDPRNKVKVFVDTSLKSRFVRNKVDKSVDAYKIDPLDFYSYMQAGLIFRFLKLEDGKITNSKILLKDIAACYGVLLSKVIDQKLSISAKREDFNVLMFLCIAFFYESMVGDSKIKAIEKARQTKFLFKSVIDAECKYINNDLNMQFTQEEAEKDIYPIDKFINVLRDQYVGIGDKIDYRNFLDWFTSLYGQNSIAAIEDFSSFLQMLLLVELKAGFYNDMLIASPIKNTLPNIPKTILQMMN